VIGAVLGSALAGGLVLVVSGWTRSRKPSLEARVLPYVRDVHPLAAMPGTATSATAAVFGPVLGRTTSVVGGLLGGSASIERRLQRLGSGMTVERFRVRQLAWGGAGFAVAFAISLLVWLSQGTGTLALLVLCVVGFVGGLLACDSHLSSQVKAYERRLSEEFPVVADLLALAVAAGEGPTAGLERIASICHGALADEITRVLGDIRTGTPMATAFDALAARTGVSSIARFAEGLAVAVERGTPLVDVLHAQAADVRESARRDLIEAGGRKEISMMLPVVFLILPTTVVFAFFPGYLGLRLTSGM